MALGWKLVSFLLILAIFHFRPNFAHHTHTIPDNTTPAVPAINGTVADSEELTHECREYCEKIRQRKHSWPDSHRVYCWNTTDRRKGAGQLPRCADKCVTMCAPICDYSAFMDRYFLECPPDVRSTTTTRRSRRGDDDGDSFWTIILYVGIAIGGTLTVVCIIMVGFAVFRDRVVNKDVITNGRPVEVIQARPHVVMSRYANRHPFLEPIFMQGHVVYSKATSVGTRTR